MRDEGHSSFPANAAGEPNETAETGEQPGTPPPLPHEQGVEPAASVSPEAELTPAGANPRERSAALNQAAETYLAAQRPDNTRRTYATAWRHWADYTAEVGISALDGSLGALVGFVRWLELREYAPATVESRLTGAIVGLRHYGVPVAREASARAREELRNYRRRLAETQTPTGRGQAQPIGAEHLRALSRACPDTLAGRRDRALLLIGFTIGARAAELAALRCEDLVDDPGRGLVVRIPVTKTGTDHHDPVLPWQAEPDTCAVRAWHAWRDAASLTKGPALRPVDRWDHPHPRRGLSTNAIRAIITAAGERAELPFGISAHSLRHGFATTARRGGATDIEIADQGRWARHSRTLTEYLHREDRWTSTAAAKLGL